ncbi:MAG: hypothetical protein EA377_12655 [Phycisphaerales bacterium]|nr:MAG: hypothetical protein EA377_12655 [Phycisphaerales bacterium]
MVNRSVEDEAVGNQPEAIGFSAVNMVVLRVWSYNIKIFSPGFRAFVAKSLPGGRNGRRG